MSKKLYRVTLRGMTYSVIGPIYGIAYVIADDPDKAYKKLKVDLEKRDLGFSHQRELDKIELIAENVEYPDCNTILYL